MPRSVLHASEYKAVWLFVMFDVPVQTPENRRDYRKLHKGIEKLGFTMLQYSVYARYFPTEESSIPYRGSIKSLLPPEGQVRMITVTDHQFGKMQVFVAGKREEPEEPPPQKLLF